MTDNIAITEIIMPSQLNPARNILLRKVLLSILFRY